MSLFALRHSQEGQETLAKLLAAKYVRRGARWLNHWAPHGWYRNCLNGGTSRIHSGYGSEGILGIAFEYCGQFADSSGYINEGKVLRGFGLWGHSRQCFRYGFEAPYRHYRLFERYPHINITNEMLDAAWAELLKDPPVEWRILYKHPTALDRQFAELNFGIETRFSPRLWLKNFFRLRKRVAID